jgi:hypothetical protein
MKSSKLRNFYTADSIGGCGAMKGEMTDMDAEEYRRRAQHHLALARQMTNVAHRAALLDLAGIWMRLAQQAELNERILQQRERILAGED